MSAPAAAHPPTPPDLAPVGVSTYARLELLRQTIAALRANNLASATDLWIFSDAPRSGDEAKVAAVRAYLPSITGFRSVTIVERTINNRVFNNRQGMRTLLERYGHLIWLEEDVVTAPSFLDYMNQALSFYRDDPRVMSIAGYMPPINLPADYAEEVFFLPRFDAWGFGIWRDRFDLIEMNSAPRVELLLRNATQRRAFRRCGEDMLDWVQRDAAGTLDALDVKTTLSQFFLDRVTVYPVGSQTHNVGFDGCGAHCGTSRQHDVMLAPRSAPWQFPTEVRLNERIVDAHYLFRSAGTPLHSWKRRRRRMKEMLRQYWLQLRDLLPTARHNAR